MSTCFAKIKNNIVIDILLADQTFINSLPSEDGITYVQYIDNAHLGKVYDRDNNEIGETSQMNCASVGGFYDSDKDIFYDEQPYPSWTLTSDYDWEAPITEPIVGEDYYVYWDEDVHQADNTKGWVTIEIPKE